MFTQSIYSTTLKPLTILPLPSRARPRERGASGAVARDKKEVEMREERFCDSKTEMCYFQI